MLTTGCNTAIAKGSKYIEKTFASLTDNIEAKTKDATNLLEIIPQLSTKGLPVKTLLISFDIVDMISNNDNMKGIHAVKIALDSRYMKKLSTEYIIKGKKV